MDNTNTIPAAIWIAVEEALPRPAPVPSLEELSAAYCAGMAPEDLGYECDWRTVPGATLRPSRAA